MDLIETLEDLLNHSPSELLNYGIQSLRLFILSNFAGVTDFSFMNKNLSDELCLPEKQCEIINELSIDFIKPFKKTRNIELLWLAKKIIVESELLTTYQNLLWKFRTLFTLTLILEDHSITIKEQIKTTIVDLETCWENEAENFLKAEWLLERMYFHLYFYEYNEAKQCLEEAFLLAGIKINLIGLLGKRTKFQQKDVAQLTVTATSIYSDKIDRRENDLDVPLNCMLNDDTLLDKISLSNKDDTKINLSPIQLGCVLATEMLEKHTHHQDEILKERLITYIDEIISQRRNFPIQMRALAERCELEKGSRRRVDRACRQVEVLTKLLDGVDNQVHTNNKNERFFMLLASNPLPFWKMHALHATILRSLGCTGEALRIYESIEDWDQVVDCYKSLDQLEKAEQLVRRLLHYKEDPVYYCLLGDITRNVDYYEKAIKISNDHSARARKALGNLMLARNQFDMAYNHLKRSVKLQPIQIGTWFNMGHCAWKLERYQEAATAYHRCVSFEPEHFEAWNNLAASYIRLDQKPRAQKILQEALKFNYDHANIWENYLLICVDVADFSQAIEAYHRCIELKHRFQDDEVLEIIVNQVLLLEENENSNRIKEQIKKLLGRISSSQTTSPRFWYLYAQTKKPSLDSSDRNAWIVYFDLKEKYLRLLLNEKNWQLDEKKCITILDNAIILADERKKSILDNESEKVFSKIRMSLRPLLSLLEKTYGVDCCSCANISIQEKYRYALELLNSL